MKCLVDHLNINSYHFGKKPEHKKTWSRSRSVCIEKDGVIKELKTVAETILFLGIYRERFYSLSVSGERVNGWKILMEDEHDNKRA